MYLETLEHGVYRVLLIDDDGIPQITESRHVTFDESKFPGAPSLDGYMDSEAESDNSSYAESSGTESDTSIELSVDKDIVDDQSHSDNDKDNDDQAAPPLEETDDDSHQDNDDDDDDDDDGIFEGAHDETPQPDPQDDGDDGSQTRRYPSRSRRKPPAWYMATSAHSQSVVKVTTSDEPTLREALNSTPEEQALWQSAIDEELQALDDNDTWYRDDSPGSQPLPTHPVLKVKRNADGTVQRFKARVVAGGNFQRYGENYKETYAPVVSFTVVRIFLYLTMCLGMRIGQLDVKTAFLNGELAESVWVMSPRGIPGVKSQCYRLKKAMYGLKQAHLAWHTKLCTDLNGIGFFELPSAPCVFRRKCVDGMFYEYILVYVDDLLVLAHTTAARNAIVEELKSLYKLRVADGVTLFLGVQLKWTTDSHGHLTSLKMYQPQYTESTLRRFGLQESKPALTPMIESFFTGLDAEDDKTVVDVERYQQMIGCLLYLALRSRPDILVSVLILARFQNAPTAYCHRGAKRVLRYLRGSTDFGMFYSTGSLDMNSFVDSDYAGDTVDRKSMSGYLVKLGEATVMWGAKKQTAVALSTCEAEYHAMTEVAQEVIWIRRVLQESGLKVVTERVPIKSDNQAAIGWATSEKCPSKRAKHIDVRVHFIRGLVKKLVVEVGYVPTDENDADMLTKPLGPRALDGIRTRLGLGG